MQPSGFSVWDFNCVSVIATRVSRSYVYFNSVEDLCGFWNYPISIGRLALFGSFDTSLFSAILFVLCRTKVWARFVTKRRRSLIFKSEISAILVFYFFDQPSHGFVILMPSLVRAGDFTNPYRISKPHDGWFLCYGSIIRKAELRPIEAEPTPQRSPSSKG